MQALSKEDQDKVAAFYKDKGALDLGSIIKQAATEARAKRVHADIAKLEVVTWQDLKGPDGTGAPIPKLKGGYGQVYQATWNFNGKVWHRREGIAPFSLPPPHPLLCITWSV